MDPRKRLPVSNDHKMLAVVTLKETESGDMGRFGLQVVWKQASRIRRKEAESSLKEPETQLFGATATVLHYDAVSRAIATVAARWLKLPFLGPFGDFGIVATESAMQAAIRAFAAMNGILGFGLKVTKSEWGTRIQFLG